MSVRVHAFSRGTVDRQHPSNAAIESVSKFGSARQRGAMVRHRHTHTHTHMHTHVLDPGHITISAPYLHLNIRVY